MSKTTQIIPENDEIIVKYLEHYKHSYQSQKTRKSALKYFFSLSQFGYTKHVFKITTDVLIDYFEYLKNLETLSLSTKKTKWSLLISFLEYCTEYYHRFNFIVAIPKKTINWNGFVHKKPKNNKNVVLTKDELVKILRFLKMHKFQYYLIFRVFAETGMRKGELIKLNLSGVNLKNRTLTTTGKTGEKTYYISKQLAQYLEIYLQERDLRATNSNALFISNYGRRYSNRPFNLILKQTTKKLGIQKNITCHTFRKSLNTFRYEMGCPDSDLEFLLGHKISINRDYYVKLSPEQKLELFDKWDPYNELNF